MGWSIRRVMAALIVVPVLAVGFWWSNRNCAVRAVTTRPVDAAPNAPRTWTDLRIPNLVHVVVVDSGWGSSVVEVEDVLWTDESAGVRAPVPGPGTAIEVENPIRYPGCAPDRGDRFVVSLSRDGSSVWYESWLRVGPDGSLIVDGGPDPQLDQRVFEAGTGGTLDQDAMVAFATDLAAIDRSTVQARIEAGEPLDRMDGRTQGPMDAAMVENLAVLAERGQSPNW